MKNRTFATLFSLLFVFVLSACGPSAEEQATMTAAAWTATPLPTATPTPIPYDLSLNIVDGEGNLIEGASVTFVELDETQQSDASGQMSWTNLGSDAASFTVAAQGYFTAEASTALERGSNTLEIVLERDPYGLLSAEACAPSENLLYVEDFQDNSSPEWGQIDFRAAGWGILDRSDQIGNLVATYTTLEVHAGESLAGYSFDQAVWRFLYFASGRAAPAFNWRQSWGYEIDAGQIEDGRYMIILPTHDGSDLRHLELPAIGFSGAASGFRMRAGEWHLVEISTFEGLTQAWVDGTLIFTYRDPRPVPPGTIGFEILDGDPDADVYFDNIAVCELTEPFTSLYVAPSE